MTEMPSANDKPARRDPIRRIVEELDRLERALGIYARELTRRDILRDLLQITAGVPADQELVLDFALTYAMERGLLAESGSIFVNVPAGVKQALRLLFKKVLAAEGTIHKVPAPDEFQTFEEGEGFAGYVLASGESVYSNNPPDDPRYSGFSKISQLKSLMCVPVKCGTTVAAVLSIHNRQSDRRFTPRDLAFVEDLAAASALCIRAYHSDLTMLPSRPLMDELLKREIQWARAEGKPLALAYIDMDNFAEVNRLYTHDGADQIIRQFAGVIRENIGDNTIPCHRHGDEFAIIFRDYAPPQALATAERIRAAVEERNFTVSLPDREAKGAKITTSVGLACWRDPMTYYDLTEKADQANAAAKYAGRNRVEFLD